MKIIEPAAIIIDEINADQIMKKLETCGRVCYKSENKTLDGSAETFIRGIVKRGHESVLEHVSISVRFICDRGVSHEIVRHRIASYSQESTRYCNYMKDDFGSEITVIRPNYLDPDGFGWFSWKNSCELAEQVYFNMLQTGFTAQEARAVLPNSLKTELIMTAYQAINNVEKQRISNLKNVISIILALSGYEVVQIIIRKKYKNYNL